MKMNAKLIIKGFLFFFLLYCFLSPRSSPDTPTLHGRWLTIKKLRKLPNQTNLDSTKNLIYQCLYTPQPIQIDGELSEWIGTPPMILNDPRQVYYKVKWHGASDLSARAYALWEQNYFYFACEVADDEFDPKENHVYNRSGDWLQLIFHPDTTNQFYRDKQYTREFGFMLTEEGPKVWLCSSKDNKPIKETELQIAIKSQRYKKFSKITYECTLPWRKLAPLLPLLQNQCQFGLSIMDDDGDGHEGLISWTPHHSFGTLILAPKPFNFHGLINFFRINRQSFDDFTEARVQFGILQSEMNLPVTIFSQLTHGDQHILLEDIDITEKLTQAPSIFEINWYTELMAPGHYRLTVGIEDCSGHILTSKDYSLFKYTSRDFHETINRLDKIIQQYQTITDDWSTDSNLPTLKYALQKIRFKLNHIHDENDFLSIQNEILSVRKALEAIWGGDDLVRKNRGEFVKAYWSEIDRSAWPYVLYVPPNYDPTERYPLVLDLAEFNETTPYSSLENCHFSEQAKQRNWILVTPFCRGNSENLNFRLDNVLKVIDELQRHYSIDENRIFLTGRAAGATDVWSLGLNFPQYFAAIAPFGGNPFVEPEQTWEQIIFNYKKKSKVARQNFKKLKWLPISIYYQENDPLLSFETMERAIDLLDKYDIDYYFQEYTKVNCPEIPEDIHSQLYNWFAQHQRNRFPPKLFLQCKRLKNNRIYWIQMDAFEKFYRYANLEVEVKSKNRIKVNIENVRQYTLFLDSSFVSFDRDIRVHTEGNLSYEGPIPENQQLTISFRRDSVKKKYRWLPGKLKHFDELHKSPEMEGPIYDLYRSKFIILYDDIHPNQAGRNWENLARKVAEQWEKKRFARPRMMKLSEFSPKEAKTANLIYFGFPDAIPFLKKYPGFLPIECDSHSVKISNNKINHKHIAVEFIYPNPINRKRYLLINTGISRLNLGDGTLDFIAVDRSKPRNDLQWVLAAGYFNQIWDVADDLLWIYKRKER